MEGQKYLKLLANIYQSPEAVASQIINLSAIKSLPKGTEYFFSDLHGEYEAFIYLLKSASGMIRTKIDMVFGKTLTNAEIVKLEQLIYYPDETLEEYIKNQEIDDEWRRIRIYQLIQICEIVSAKYTRSRVRNRMPEKYRFILDELLNVTDDINKEFYFNEIIKTIIDTKIADSFISELCKLIQRLAIDEVHIIGDIFDRGPRADIILEELIKFGKVDIQWGNHDISWMGASVGCEALIAVVIRISMSYNNFDLLEDGYGINLRPLSEFASKIYAEDPCERFMPHMLDDNQYDPIGKQLVAKMHKAITIIQLKLEGKMVKEHPEFEMEDRNLLERIDYSTTTIKIGDKTYQLEDKNFPTINPDNPLELTHDEQELMDVLVASFKHAPIFQKHISFIFKNGSMYKKINNNLLYHGCIPMNKEGEFISMEIDGNNYSGKGLLDKIDKKVSEAFCSRDEKVSKNAKDLMWYLWCGSKSPLFGKSKMATFEGYFINDAELKKEIYSDYYTLVEEEKNCDNIMKEFGIDIENGHIINGHVPVKIKDGESPIKANGKLFIIDGGISKAYQSATGIAGYTLIYDSHALRLAEHKPFQPMGDNTPKVQIVKRMEKRVNIADTDKGKKLDEEINDLRRLLEAYENNMIK